MFLSTLRGAQGWAIFTAVCIGSLLAKEAQADLLTSYTGWSEMANTGSSAGGVVDFAVYQNAAGHNWASDLGLSSALTGANAGGGPAVTTAPYVYFYQVINNEPVIGNGSISDFKIASGAAHTYTSGGWLNGMVFNDGAPIGPSRNVYLGLEQLPFPPYAPLSNLLSRTGEKLSGSGFSRLGGTTAPAGLGSLSGVGGGAANFLWTTLTGNQLLNHRAFSPVLFLTSDQAPEFAAGTLSGTVAANPSSGAIAAADPIVPEPPTFAICGMGMLTVVLFHRRRRPMAC